MLTTSFSGAVTVQSKDQVSPGFRGVGKDRSQVAKAGSLLSTALSVVSPVSVSTKWKVTASPGRAAVVSAVLVTEMPGWSTLSRVEADAVTGPPTGGVPVAVALLVKLAVGAFRTHVQVRVSPAARVRLVRSHADTAASTTSTPVSGTSPLLVTVRL